MDRTLRGLIGMMSLSALGLVSPPASAECTFATVYTGDCDFKNEDTHLWWWQPGAKFTSDEVTDTLVQDAWATIYNYYATTKVTGDGAIRGDIDKMKDDINEAIAEAAVDLAATAYNDPIDLKPMYTDVICDVFWGAVADLDCKTTSELVLDAQRLWDLSEVRIAIAKLQTEPFLFLGEEWGGIADDLIAIRDQFDELETIGENLDPDTIAAEIGRRFKGYAEVLAGPKTSEADWLASQREISKTLHATLADTMAASKEISDQSIGDEGELATLQQFSRDSVGRMQQMELGNMTGTQSNQEWLKIQRLMTQRGNLIGVDMAAEMNAHATARAEGARMREQLPGVGTIVGNETGAILP